MTLHPRAIPASRWVGACVAGELLGLVCSGAGMIAYYVLFGDPSGLGAGIAAASWTAIFGAAEGAVLASFQHRVLRIRYPALPQRLFITSTAAIAATCWFIGMLIPALAGPSAAPDPPDPSRFSIALFAALFGAAVGTAFGAAQWLALRRAGTRAGLWILANTLAWTSALPIIYIGASIIPADPPIAPGILGAAAAGAFAGLTIALATLTVIPRMTPTPPDPGCDPPPTCGTPKPAENQLGAIAKR